MAGILDTLKQSNDERLAQQSALVKTPMQSVGVAARGAVNDVGALVAAPMIGVAGVAKDAYEGLKNFGAGFTGLKADAPAAPPKVITPDVSAAAQKTIDATPMVPTAAPDKFDAAVAAATKGNYTAQTAPQAIGVSTPVAAPVAAKPAAMPQVAMNTAIMEQQQNLMAQIAAAQQVVAAGSNRDGYKMGDVTKGIATMQALSPLVASSNNLLAANYGVDAGIINHTADNVTRTNISNAGNATEMAKTDLAGRFGIEGRALDNEAAVALAERKAALESASPQGQAQTVEAMTKARILKDTENLTGVGRAMATQGKYNIDQVKDGTTGNMLGAFVNGVYVPAAALGVQSPAPITKKK